MQTQAAATVGYPSGRLWRSPCSSTYQQLLPSNDMLHVFLVRTSAPPLFDSFQLWLAGVDCVSLQETYKQPSESSRTKSQRGFCTGPFIPQVKLVLGPPKNLLGILSHRPGQQPYNSVSSLLLSNVFWCNTKTITLHPSLLSAESWIYIKLGGEGKGQSWTIWTTNTLFPPPPHTSQTNQLIFQLPRFDLKLLSPQLVPQSVTLLGELLPFSL